MKEIFSSDIAAGYSALTIAKTRRKNVRIQATEWDLTRPALQDVAD